VLNTLLQHHLTESERRSWQPQDITTYEVYFQRNGEWFSKTLREQSDVYPRGTTREKAKAIAGKTGNVYKATYHRERIQ